MTGSFEKWLQKCLDEKLPAFYTLDNVVKKNRTADFKGSLQRRDFDLQDRDGSDYEENFFSVHRDVWTCISICTFDEKLSII